MESENQPTTPVVTAEATHAEPTPVEKNISATIGLVFGIIGLVALVIPILGTLVAVQAMIISMGFIFGIRGLKSLKRGLAIVAIVLSSIGLFATIDNIYIGKHRLETGQSYWLNTLLNKDTSASKTELINRMVPKIKAKLLPARELEGVTLVDVTAELGAIRFHYVIAGVDTSELTNELVKNDLIGVWCQGNGTELFNRDINVESSYSVENSTEKYFVVITKTDCK